MGRETSPLRDRVIFVEGAPRSGTTWLVTLLATHPEIAGVDAESHLFDFGIDRLFDNFEGRDPGPHGLYSYLERDELVDVARDACDSILMAMRRHVAGDANPSFVVEKTPIMDGIQRLDLARKRECYPDAWYVHIVRDREAVIRSLMRAPFMGDRSRAACAGLYDRTVNGARELHGDLPRYRELSYEALREDPAEACRGLFEWLGVSASPEVLETVRSLSREQYSDVGAVSGAATPRPRTFSAAKSRFVSGGRALLEGRRSRGRAGSGPDQASSRIAFTFAKALRECDPEELRGVIAPSLELVFRGPGGDLLLRGDDSHAALMKIAAETFSRRHVGEWWASAPGAPAEWWSAVPGKTLSTIFFSAIAGDATRVDFAIALILEGDLIRRCVIISAGQLTGRPVGETAEIAANPGPSNGAAAAPERRDPDISGRHTPSASPSPH